MPSYSELTLAQKINYAQEVVMNQRGIKQPSTTAQNAALVNQAIEELQADSILIKQLLANSIVASSGQNSYTTPVPWDQIPANLQQALLPYIPPDYSPPATISGEEIVAIEEGVIRNLQQLQSNPPTLPPVTGIGTQPTVTAPTTRSQPAPTTNPSNSRSSTTETIAKVSLAVAGVATAANIISNITKKKEPPKVTEEPTNTKAPPSTVTPPSGTTAPGNAQGITAAKEAAKAQATAQDQANFKAKEDWRVRLSLAPDSNYLYNAPDPGILAPLKKTDGVIFPYTPLVSVSYTANYDPATITHNNYKVFQYGSSSVDNVSLSCDFTAQDTFEANYLLAVIHFFRSMTKMFFGQDNNPRPGTPPPLCYMFGMGGYQFAAHPLAIQGFQYNLPNDVDYIATTAPAPAGTEQGQNTSSPTNPRGTNKIAPGGNNPAPVFNKPPNTNTTTWVPTKISIQISCVPIISRNKVSNSFSLEKYATGNLINGTQIPGGGFW